ncbi:RDD family protein [Arthrobacter sp. M4]|uniref:RDD family protein n=1 Tax=Arthrobacter sp. M4 TaxID=218160 RepID=UPI001CDCE625|nr:RDD family protein [Arthrobacter sp. M4]MCA4133579.1 RDD family protein [Arthrobacter sp. M4]
MSNPIITGEAVALELRPASFGARALGLFIDMLAYLALFIVLMFAIGSAFDGLDPAAGRALAISLFVFCFAMVPVTVETLSRGRSLGKLAVGLRVVRDDGGSIRFRHAVIRGLLGVLEIYMTLGGLAVLVALFNDKSKRLGDIAAGTYALRQRVRVAPNAPLFVPPYLVSWVQLADIGRLPDGTARRAGQFLQQLGHMSPPSRMRLGQDLATEVSAHVAPPPPAGTAPEDYLAAVLAERRRREHARLAAARGRSSVVAERIGRLPFSSSSR